MTKNFEILKNKVFKLLSNELSEIYCYHSFEHTKTMLEVAPSYLMHEHIDTKDSERLLISILFHDLGFIHDWKSHEKRGAEMASQYMNELAYSRDDIQVVEKLILATKIPQSPNTILEQIICDIDLDYLGRPDYEERSEQLYREWLELGIVKNRSEWEKKELDFLQNQRYHTSFGQKYRQPVMNQRIALILANRKS